MWHTLIHGGYSFCCEFFSADMIMMILKWVILTLFNPQSGPPEKKKKASWQAPLVKRAHQSLTSLVGSDMLALVTKPSSNHLHSHSRYKLALKNLCAILV